MHRFRLVVGCLSLASVLFAPAALADTPTPAPGQPSCGGLIVATFNHNSGPFGPSGNPNASAGPGSFLGPGTPAAIAAARAAFC